MLELSVVALAYNLSIWKIGQEDCSELEVSLVYRRKFKAS